MYIHYAKGPERSTQFSKSFQLRFRKVHAFSMTAGTGRDLASNIGPDRFTRRWKERTDTLWWNVIGFKSVAPKRVLRSYMARKVRVAFVEALKKRGVAPDGSWIDAEAQQTRKPVFGTAHMSPTIEVLTTKMEDLLLEMDKAVDVILSQQNTKHDDNKPSYVKGSKYSKAGTSGPTRNTSGQKNTGRPNGPPRAGTGIKIHR